MENYILHFEFFFLLNNSKTSTTGTFTILYICFSVNNCLGMYVEVTCANY